MPIPHLKNIISNGRSTVAQISGALGDFQRAAGQAGFSIQADPNGRFSVNVNFNQLLQNRIIGNRIVTQLRELYDPSNGRVYNPIIFPDDLDNEHYMIYNVMKRTRARAQDKLEKRPIRSIVLPIPSNLQVQYNMDYTNENLGLFGAAAAGRLSVPSDPLNNDLANVVTQRIEQATAALKSGDTDNVIQSLGTIGPIAATAAGTASFGAIGGLLALGGTSGGVISGISESEGLALNPHMAVLFRGVNFREHQFNYRFIARNQTESDRIRELIGVIKHHMHPGYTAGNLAFTYPDEFEIEFSTVTAPYLYTIGTSVMKNFSVNYNGENIPLFFEQTGAPVVIDISMQFQETKLLTRQETENTNEAPADFGNEEWMHH